MRENNEEKILKENRTIAVVGASPDAEKPSYGVFAYLKDCGYQVIPVNPRSQNVQGETCYPDLASVPLKVDVVDIFRRAEEVPSIVDQAIAIGAKVVWMQKGISHKAAAARARQAGLLVVEDKCMKIEHLKMTAMGR